MLPELELLQEKLGKLLKKYAALQAEHLRLQQLHDKQEELIAGQQQKIAELEKQVQVQAIADVDITELGIKKEDLKKYLEQVIGEIDKNLAMLK